MTGLKANTVYYVRAYATNAMGTTYGNVIPFTTIATTIPTLTTIITSNITSTTAQSGGNITSDGGTTITARGVCWSTSQNPTINDNHTSDGSGAGSFTSTMAGLKANTVYYVRAYATNAMGTAYGNQITFTTTANLPSLTTITISKITATSATGGGNITSNGGTSLIARGVCWGTSHNPTINGNHTFDGSGTGSFTSNITGLTAGTTYYVRAYAVNAVGTAYGNEVVFKTSTVDVKDVDEVNTAIKIYPNPAKDQITIIGLEKVEDIQLINTIGQIVKQYNNVNEAITISITDLSQGIYFLRIGSYVKKLVIRN
ncbi:MAG: T9SS type A sorting domain-containing protein [Bacteroidales bacterium]|nr:T9SS type A sorting domain-containing protein [Bacteroidales bacterium]